MNMVELEKSINELDIKTNNNILEVKKNIISSIVNNNMVEKEIVRLTRDYKKGKQIKGKDFNKLFKSRKFIKGSLLRRKAEKDEAVNVSFTVRAPALRLRAKKAGVNIIKGQKIKSLIPSILHAENKFKELKKSLVKLIKKIIPHLDISLKEFTASEIIKTIIEVVRRTPVLLEINNIFYTLNDNTQERLKEKIENNTKIIFGIDESDNELIQQMLLFDKITVKLVSDKQRKKDGTIKTKSGGGFFKYTHCLNDMDFSRYGIFQTVNKDNYNINCVVRAFENIGMDKETIIDLRTRIKNRIIPMCLLKELATTYNVYITVKKKDSHKKDYSYGDKKNKHIKLGLIDEHFFIIDYKTNITFYALENYEKIKDLKEWNTIHALEGKYYRRSKNKSISSNRLFEYLLNNKDRFLNEIRNSNNEIFDSQFYDKCNSYDVLEFNKDCCEPVEKYNDQLIKKQISTIEEFLNNILDLKQKKKMKAFYEDKKNNISLGELFMQFPQYAFKYVERQEEEPKTIKRLVNNIMELVSNIPDDKTKQRFIQWYEQCGASFEEVRLTYDKWAYVDYIVPVAKKEEKEKEIYDKVFFDVETMTNDGPHQAYQVSKIDMKNNKKTYDGWTCCRDLLEGLKTNTLLIAHNCAYDLRFIFKYLWNIKLLEKGHMLICCSGTYTNKKGEEIKIKIKDSYKLISMRLDDFGECFNLKQSKQIMPYTLYTKENIEKKYIPVSEALKHIKDKDHEQFKNNLKEWNILIDDEYDIIEYSKIYCEIDCIVLKEGYETFRQWILKKPFEMDIDNIISIAGLADDYLIKTGCYKGCYKLSGVVREFIQKCVVGGRTMLRDNKPNHIKKTLADYDGVSLYPSAIHRLFEKLGGFLMGKPKVIKENDLNIESLNKYDGYFIEIKITKVNKHLHFPLASKIDKKTGVRDFTNNMVDETIFVDKIALNDLINFQKIEFEIIKGYYFNEGRNPISGAVILSLFQERLKKKEEGNPIQLVYKLIMNSSYGRTILKPYKTKTKIVDNKDIDDYVQRNYNFIIDYSPIPNSTLNKVELINSIIRHYTRPHIGVEILSMSKRIMNEVMCLAEDKKLMIHYQDTDSMHIQYNQVEKLEKLFKKEYKRDLTGKNLGQFHIDFEIKGCKKATNIKSVESYFIAKKTYIDKLQYEDEDKNIKYDYHVRMKSIPNNTIRYTANKRKVSMMGLYDELYKNKEIPFDLLKGMTPDGEMVNNCAFVFEKNMNIKSRPDFVRFLNKKKKIKKIKK